jgi:hypothetical protein
MTPKEKADEIFTHYHNLIQEIGGELGQEIIVSILAKQCAIKAVTLIVETLDNLNTDEEYDKLYYWRTVKEILKYY